MEIPVPWSGSPDEDGYTAGGRARVRLATGNRQRRLADGAELYLTEGIGPHHLAQCTL
jgi:hypothetical protein